MAPHAPTGRSLISLEGIRFSLRTRDNHDGIADHRRFSDRRSKTARALCELGGVLLRRLAFDRDLERVLQQFGRRDKKAALQAPDDRRP